MNFQRFEGMGAAVGIVLIIMIITWLGLWGPVNLDAVKGWQQLIVGCLAIGAALIAYWGSSATARFSARIHREELQRKKLAMYLKLEFSCRQLREQGRSAGIFVGQMNVDVRYDRERFVIDEPAEIEEAWAHLDILPRSLISEMRALRNSIREMAALLKANPQAFFIWPADADHAIYPVFQLGQCANVVWQSATVISDTLEPLIVEMAPEMDQQQKMSMIYGEPDIPDIDDFDEELHAGTASRQP
jgi:hypothetical protein